MRAVRARMRRRRSAVDRMSIPLSLEKGGATTDQPVSSSVRNGSGRNGSGGRRLPQRHERPNRRVPAPEALATADPKIPRDFVSGDLADVPEVQKVAVPLVNPLHPAA